MTPLNTTKLAIVEQLHRLNVDELEVVLEVAQGLVNGRKVYGELMIDTDQRDFARERWEENRDALVYASIEAIKKRRGA